jgi:hypothetical protein
VVHIGRTEGASQYRLALALSFHFNARPKRFAAKRNALKALSGKKQQSRVGRVD